VTHIQKESSGMNKLYSQSMCSVKQWRSYQAAEAMVSSEVEEVKSEADLVEPGWSQVIWRQAMQYHNMLKQKHEMEQKAAAEAVAKKKVITKEQSEADKVKAAEKAAEDLIKGEESESKKAFTGGVKKGFLDTKKKVKK
jgi:cytoskeletal protein RodZ